MSLRANFRVISGILAFMLGPWLLAAKAVTCISGHCEQNISSGLKPMDFFKWDRKTLRHTAIFALALIALGIIVHEVIGPNGYLTYRREKQEYNNLQQQIQSLSQRNHQLRQKIHSLKNNPEAVEKQARDQLHLVKPGELIYMLPDRKPAETANTAQQTSRKPQR